MSKSKRIKAPVERIYPNPANFKTPTYILDKVEYLKDTIQDTKFWNSIPAREIKVGKETYYEIGCGHHRVKALKELGYSEVPLEVEERSDIEMIKILFQENMNNSRHPLQVNNTVWGTQDFLNSKIEEIKTFEDFKKSEWGSILPVESEIEFKALKRDGVSSKHIHFIVKDFWPLRTIQESLKYRDNPKIDSRVLEIFNSQHQLDLFNRNINKYGVENYKDQVKIAKKIMKEDKFSSKVMDEAFKDRLKKRSPTQKAKDRATRSKPSISETLAECISSQSEINAKLSELITVYGQINSHEFNEYILRIQRLITILLGSDKINDVKQLIEPENKNLIEGE